MIRRIALLLLVPSLALSAATAHAASERSIWLGGDTEFSQAVEGPLVAIGGNITVSAPVAGTARLVGGKVTIAPSAAIHGDVSVAAGDLAMDGSIDGQLRAAAGKVRINGPVTGDASIAAGTLELGPEARVQGKLTFRGDDLRRDPAAQVTGGIEHTAGHSRWHGWHERTAGERFIHGWIWTLGLMVLAALIAAALPGPSNHMAAELREHPGITTLLGLIALITIPVAAVLLMVTIIGIPIGLLALMGYGILLLVGYVWLAVVVGGMLLDRVKPQTTAVAAWRAGAAVLAMLVIALLARVPYVGGLAHLVALVLGVGMIAAVVFRQRLSPGAAAAA